MEEKTILKATTGTTATLAYEVTFEDATKKTVTVGNYRTQDLPNSQTLHTNITAVNSAISSGSLTDFKANFISNDGAYAQAITGCTVTVKTIAVYLDNYYGGAN